MKRKKTIILTAAVISLLAVCLCGGIGGYALWNMPLGLQLAEENPQAIPAADIQLSTEDDVPPAVPTAGLPSAQPAVTEPVANCGEKGSVNILIMGVDSPIPSGPAGPLDLRIVKINFSEKNAVVFSFPRDLWLPIQGLEAFGFSQSRLGEAYLIARSNAGLSIAASTNLVAENLAGNFGAVSNHYITAKMSTLASMIDTLGGIDVNIPTAYDGTSHGFHYFPAGIYHLSGVLALEYAIAPSSPGQWTALDRKNQVLTALYQRIFSPDIIPAIPALIPQFLQSVATDLSMQQIMDLICIAQHIPNDQITVTGIGPSEVTYGESGVLYPKTDVIRAKVGHYLYQ